jgi:DNA-binding protein HU-beta
LRVRSGTVFRRNLRRVHVNKAELIDAIADRLEADRRSATNAVEAVLDTITRAVAGGEKVAITGFGVFEKSLRKARTGRNPQTGAVVKIKATAVPKFRAAAPFKEVVSGAKKLAKATPLGGRGAKATTKKATAKKSPAKKTAAKSTARKAPAKKAPARKAAAKKTARR